MSVKHDVQCIDCEAIFEATTIDAPCVKCGSENVLWLPKANFYKFEAFYHPHLGHEPVYVESVQQLDRILEERKLHIPHDSQHAPRRRLPQSEEEARELN